MTPPPGTPKSALPRIRPTTPAAPAPRKPKKAARPLGARADVLDERADTAVRLLREVQEGRVDAKALPRATRKSLLILLAGGKQTSTELAAIFGVSAKAIRQDLREIRAEVGREVRQWGADEVVGDLAMSAEKLHAMALRNDDLALAWTIKRDFAKTLRELGVVGPQERDGLRVTIEALGEGYEKARAILSRTLDPRLTGEIVVPAAPVPELPGAPTLPSRRRGQDPAELPPEDAPGTEEEDDEPRELPGGPRGRHGP